MFAENQRIVGAGRESIYNWKNLIPRLVESANNLSLTNLKPIYGGHMEYRAFQFQIIRCPLIFLRVFGKGTRLNSPRVDNYPKGISRASRDKIIVPTSHKIAFNKLAIRQKYIIKLPGFLKLLLLSRTQWLDQVITELEISQISGLYFGHDIWKRKSTTVNFRL